MPKQRGSESGKEAAQAVEWTAQRGWKRKRKTRVSRKEAAAEIESDGRRKEIAENNKASTERLGPLLHL